MKYELSEVEVDLIKTYRKLLEEWQRAASENVQSLYQLQVEVIRNISK